MTNTNWQSYVPEATMSYFVQMAALAMQNFASAAAGHRGRDRADPRLRAAGDEDDRQLLGGCHARTVYVLLPFVDRGACCCARRA